MRRSGRGGRSRGVVAALAAAALLCVVTRGSAQPPVAPASAEPSKDPAQFLRRPPRPATVKGAFNLVAIGDLLYSHPLASYPDPKLQQAIALIRTGDVTIGNKEGVFFDLKAFRGSGYGDGLLWGEAALGADMRAMGIDMVSVANNHSMDFGWSGLRDSLHLLDDAGIAYAGGGRSLSEARQAGYLRTPKGVIALVAAASTFKPNAGANDAFEDVPARPGISLLRWRKVNLVTASQMALIRRLATERASPYEPAPAADARQVSFGGELYRLADHAGLHYQMNLYDLAGLLQAVRVAKRNANLVVFTIHTHETATGEDDDNPQPPDFLIRLAHDVVDAGADVFIGTGIHDLRGIEIYKGRPVFYGMSSFFINGEIKMVQESALQAYADSGGKAAAGSPHKTAGSKGCYQVRSAGNPRTWYDSMVAVTDFDQGRARTVTIHPLDLGDTCDRSRRGLPHLAAPADARRILADLQSYSAPFGTRIAVDGSVGVIRIP